MADSPRLLIITPDFPPAPGGIQTVVHRLACGMDAFATRVVAPDAPGAERFDSEGALAVTRVPAHQLLRGQRVAALNAAALRHALDFRPDVTLSAHIVTSPAAAVIRRALGARTLQYFYAEEIPAKPRLAAFAASQAHVSIALSSYTAELLAAAGASTERVRTVPPGVDLPEDATPQLLDRPTVLTVARMHERYKGHDILVRALCLVRAKVPNVQWIVIGDGTLRPGLEALARASGVADSISFLGAVSDRERDRWLRRAHVLAMPSRLPAPGLAGEGFGIAFLEAGTYGKPVVAGNVGGALDAVVDREGGLLVDPTDPLVVAEAISELLLDHKLAARLGAAGAERARSFAWPLIAARVQALLLEQLA